MSALGSVVERFSSLRVLVVGDPMLDVYLEGDVPRLCREAPVPLVRLDHRTDVPGGAANTAVNLRALGADVSLLGVVGDDENGARLRRCLEETGVRCTELVVDRARETLALHRVVGSSQLLVRFDAGSREGLAPEAEEQLVDHLGARWIDADVVVVSDYAYGTVSARVVDAMAALQRRHPTAVVVDSKHVVGFRRVRPTAVKPNWSEARQLLIDRLPAGELHRVEAVGSHGEDILDLTGARIAAVTLDREGAIVFERGCPPYRTYASPTSSSLIATGAGDTFVSALALALGAGASTPSAAELASAAAGVVVDKQGTATCTAAELRRAVAGYGKVLAGPEELAGVVQAHRRRGRRIVFTNGCFDILHRGHTSYLNRAKLLGDVLVVAVNDDDSVRGLKGADRPINPLDDRLRVLAALSCVDHLVAFGGESPTALLEAARPDVFAKGGDYTRATLPEADLVDALGGTVEILPIEPDLSTTRIIERVRSEAASQTLS